MEEATTSSGFRGDGERGAGGKFRKPPARKPPATPYDRPPSSAARQPQAVHHRDGGWLSRLVDPARRLISGGATRLFPSFFSKHPPSDYAAASEAQDCDYQQDSYINIQDTENLGLSTSTIAAGLDKEAYKPKLSSDIDTNAEDKEESLCDDDKLSEIEQILKGKNFSKEEISRLTELLHSKVIDLPTVDTAEEKPNTDAAGEAEELHKAQESWRKSVEEKQENMTGSIFSPAPPSTYKDISDASPVDIARAFMGNRKSEMGIGYKSTILKDPGVLSHKESALKPFAPSPLPPSSICWPGAVVREQGSYVTPQTQRGRSGLHNFPRTPYSRTIYSNSKSKSQLDGSQNSKTPATFFQQSQTPTFGLTRSREPALGGSVGPVRRMRHKFVSGTTKESASYLSSEKGPLQVESFLPSLNMNLDLGATSSTSKFQSTDHIPSKSEVGASTVHPQSSQLARRILEHIDRIAPTPKEKSAELNLVSRPKKMVSSEMAPFISKEIDRPQFGVSDSDKNLGLTDPKFSSQWNHREGDSISKVRHHQRIDIDADLSRGYARTECDVNAGPSQDLAKPFGSQINSASQITNARPESSSSVPNDKSHLWPLHSQSNGKVDSYTFPKSDVHDHLSRENKLPPHSSRAKRGLSSISINKPDLEGTASFDKNFGFTFPTTASSGVLSDLPTPSVLPSTLNSGLHEPDVIPSYSFGTKNSRTSLVFSFPSSSGGMPQNASDIKFDFGSDKKTRVSFSQVGKNAVCF